MSNLPAASHGAIYVVPKGIKIMVSNSALTLTSHVMKKAMFFDNTRLLTGTKMKNHEEIIYPFMMRTHLHQECGEGQKITVSQLLTNGYFTFETGDVVWPWLVAPKSLFAAVNKPKSDFIGGQGKAWDH